MDISIERLKSLVESKQYGSKVEEPFTYLLRDTSGKNMRGKIIRTFNYLYGINPKMLEQLEAIVNILHVSSLMIDDVEDSSNMRRGKPCVHKIYGIAQTINAGNYEYFQALKLIQKMFDPKLKDEAVEIFTEEMINLHTGQGLDLYWRENQICPTEDEYMTTVLNKTGGLFRLAVRLMELCSGKHVAPLIDVCNILGLMYQVKDDYLNLESDKYYESKGFCDDITEGKFSFPIVHALHVYGKESEAYREILGILRLHTEDPVIKKQCLELISKGDGLSYSKKTIEGLCGEVKRLMTGMFSRYECKESSSFFELIGKLGELDN